METVEEMNLAYIELSVTDTKRAAYVLSDKCGLGNFKIMEDRLIRIYDKKATVQDLTKALAMNEVDIAAFHPPMMDNPHRIGNAFDFRKDMAGNHNGNSVFQT